MGLGKFALRIILIVASFSALPVGPTVTAAENPLPQATAVYGVIATDPVYL
jgi:hypothetical protein